MTGPPRVPPDDEHNRLLVHHAHPEAWPVPDAGGRWNLVVIGGGTAGLVTALGAAGLGARVALVERHLLGGDCLVTGCVPSKGVLAAAHALHAARHAGSLGVDADARFDFGTAMTTMRRNRAAISHHDSAQRLTREGVAVFLGEARFTGPDTVEVGGATLRFARACIASGARPSRPPIPGLDEAGVRTSEDWFDLATLPRRVVVIGGGPVGCEMAQAFARFGSEVTLVEALDRVLPGEEAEASAVLAQALHEDGVSLRTSTTVTRLGRDGDARFAECGGPGGDVRVVADEILLAIGRTPNVEGLDLDRAGVEWDRRGVGVDDHLRTSNPRVYAAGDVCTERRFTHAADAMARVVIRNALFFGRARASALLIPRATYTDPEVAHVGISAEEAAGRGDVVTFTEPMARNDRSLLEGETRGYVRAHTLRDGTIVGATAVARDAGELIAPIALALANGVKIGAVADTILPYPTRSEAWRRVGAQWHRTRLTPFTSHLLRTLLRWRR